MAWRCEQCGETISDDDFQVCWNCGSARKPEGSGSVPDTSSASTAPLPPPLPETDPPHERLCPSCHIELQLRGTVPVRLSPPDEEWDLLPRGWERDGKLWGLEAWICRFCRRVLLYEVRH